MNANTDDEKQIDLFMDVVKKMVQGRNGAEGMMNLHLLIEHLLLVHKAVVAAIDEENIKAECKQNLLNLLMMHVLTPYDDADELRESMARFAMLHKAHYDVRAVVFNKEDGSQAQRRKGVRYEH